MLSFNTFVSSSKSLNESLNKPAYFEYTDDSIPNKALYIVFDIGSTKYGASLVETKYTKVFRLSVYRIVNSYRKPWSFKSPAHIRIVLATVVDFLEKTVPYLYVKMDAIILDVTEKSDIAKYQSLFKRIIRVNPKLKKYDLAPVAKTSEKKNDNFMFVVKNGLSATDIFKSAAFKKHYSFVTNQDGSVNADILGNVETKKIEKPQVSLEPSKKFVFNVLEVEYELDDTKLIQKLEKTKSEIKGAPKDDQKVSIKDLKVEANFGKLKPGDIFVYDYSVSGQELIEHLVIAKVGDFLEVQPMGYSQLPDIINVNTFNDGSRWEFVKVIGYKLIRHVNPNPKKQVFTDFKKLKPGDVIQFFNTNGDASNETEYRITAKNGDILEYEFTGLLAPKRKLDISGVKYNSGFETVIGYRLIKSETIKIADEPEPETDFTKLQDGDVIQMYFGGFLGWDDADMEVKNVTGDIADFINKNNGKIYSGVNLKNIKLSKGIIQDVEGYSLISKNIPNEFEKDFSKLREGDVFLVYYENKTFNKIRKTVNRYYVENRYKDIADILEYSNQEHLDSDSAADQTFKINVKNVNLSSGSYYLERAVGYELLDSAGKPISSKSTSSVVSNNTTEKLESDFNLLEVGDMFKFAINNEIAKSSNILKVTDKYGPYLIVSSVDTDQIKDEKIDFTKIDYKIQYVRVREDELKQKDQSPFEINSKIFEDPNARNDMNEIGVLFASCFIYAISMQIQTKKGITQLEDAYNRFVENREELANDDYLINGNWTYDRLLEKANEVLSSASSHSHISIEGDKFMKAIRNNQERKTAFFDMISLIPFSVIRNSISIARAGSKYISGERLNLDQEPKTEVEAFLTANDSQPFAGELGYAEHGPPPEDGYAKIQYLTTKDKNVSKWYVRDYKQHRNSDDPVLSEGVQALYDYTGSYAYDMNQEMRGVLGAFEGKEDEEVQPIMNHSRSLMKYFEVAAPKLEKGIWVYRNVGSHPDPESLSIKDDYIDPGFMSTTINSQMSYGSGQMRLKIYLPAGTKCFPILEKSKNSGEQEIVLPALSILSITKIFKLKKYDRPYYILECIYTGTAMYSFMDEYEKRTQLAAKKQEINKAKYPDFEFFPSGISKGFLVAGDEYVINGGDYDGEIARVTSGGYYSIDIVLAKDPDTKIYDISLEASSPNKIGQKNIYFVKKIDKYMKKQGFVKRTDYFSFSDLKVGDQYVIKGGTTSGKIATVINKDSNKLGISVEGYKNENVIDMKFVAVWDNTDISGTDHPEWLKLNKSAVDTTNTIDDNEYPGFEQKEKLFTGSHWTWSQMNVGDQYVIHGGINTGKIATIKAKKDTNFQVKIDGSVYGFVSTKPWDYQESMGMFAPNLVKLVSKDESIPAGFKEDKNFDWKTLEIGDQYIVNGGPNDGKIAMCVEKNLPSLTIQIDNSKFYIDSEYPEDYKDITGHLLVKFTRRGNSKVPSGFKEVKNLDWQTLGIGDQYIIDGGPHDGKIATIDDKPSLNVIKIKIGGVGIAYFVNIGPTSSGYQDYLGHGKDKFVKKAISEEIPPGFEEVKDFDWTTFEKADAYIINGGPQDGKIATIKEKVPPDVLKVKINGLIGDYFINIGDPTGYENYMGHSPVKFVKYSNTKKDKMKLAATKSVHPLVPPSGFKKVVNFDWKTLEIGDQYIINGGYHDRKIATVADKPSVDVIKITLGGILGYYYANVFDITGYENYLGSKPVEYVKIKSENEEEDLPDWMKKKTETPVSAPVPTPVSTKGVNDFDWSSLGVGDKYYVNGGSLNDHLMVVEKVFKKTSRLKVRDDKTKISYSIKYVDDSSLFSSIAVGTKAPTKIIKAGSDYWQSDELDFENKKAKTISAKKATDVYYYPEGVAFDNMMPGDEYVVNGGPMDGAIMIVVENDFALSALTVRRAYGDMKTLYTVLYGKDEKTMFSAPQAGTDYPTEFTKKS
jgi:hypothetical protein